MKRRNTYQPFDSSYIFFLSANIKGSMEATGEHYTKNGKDYIKLGNYKIDVDIGKPHLKFGRIFGDNDELNERTNNMINENIVEIAEEIKPVIIEVIAQFVFGIERRVFDKYSYDVLFPN